MAKGEVTSTRVRKEGRPVALLRGLTRRPITHALIALSSVWSFLLWRAQSGDWRSLGISDGFSVFGGDYWSLLASIFAHVNVVHLFFNVYWLAILGGYVEEQFGNGYYVVFILVCSFCSSALELSFSGETGVGLSGVVYGIFGFLWGAKLFGKQQLLVLEPKTIQVFMVWLFLCLLLSASGMMAIGNVAHFTGLLVGLATALACYKRFVGAQWFLPALVVLCAVLLFYSPWSDSWLQSKAYKAHKAGQYHAAEDYYSRLLERNPDDTWALENRASVRGELGKGSEAQKDLEHAREIKKKK